jgi:hypothetical protein
MKVEARDSDARTTARTFLIADVRGYTRFTRERGDAEAARLAKKFADVARDSVDARSGRVIELRGDEALAVFGSLISRTKRPRRGVTVTDRPLPSRGRIACGQPNAWQISSDVSPLGPSLARSEPPPPRNRVTAAPQASVEFARGGAQVVGVGLQRVGDAAYGREVRRSAHAAGDASAYGRR